MENSIPKSPQIQPTLLNALADFRCQLRAFLQLSEHAAQQVHLHPQQHQLLLQIAGAPADAIISIAYAAERLGLRHHTVVELTDRCAAEDLLLRTEDPLDRRRVILSITKKGQQILHTLSEYHAHELRDLGPRLIRSLKHIETMQTSSNKRPRSAQ